MNKIVILGRLTKDPEVRYTPSQKVVCAITLAVDRPFLNQQGQREADFIPVVLWGKAAELCGNSCAKGHRLLIEGRLQIRSYDGKDGQRRWITEVIASSMEFIERKADAARGQQAPAANAAPPANRQPDAWDAMGTPEPYDEEVPF